MKRLALVLVVVAAAVGVGGELVHADAPMKQGWWSKWQQTSTPSLPSAGPLTPPPATVPAPPTGDDGGLTVAHGPEGPEAVAAMYFQVEAPVDASLYLPAAPKKKAGTPDPTTSTTVDVEQAPEVDTIVLPPGATVLACRALSEWDRENNGPWSRAPTWSTEDCVPGALVSGGTAMFWTLFPNLQDDDQNYDIILVTNAPPPPSPAGSAPPQSSFMVNFASPGADTLVAEEYDEEPPPPDPEPEPEPEPEPDPEPEPIPAIDEGTGISGPPLGGFTTPTTTAGTPPTSLVAAGRPTPRGTPFSFPDTRAERIMAVSLLLFMAVALWWLGGSPARMPRLIGAVGARSPASPLVPPDRLRGVGRFARLRDGRAPRL